MRASHTDMHTAWLASLIVHESLIRCYPLLCRAAMLRWLGVPSNELHYECFGPAIADIEAAGNKFPVA